MTPAELANRTAPWRNARDEELRLRPERDAAIREALAAGMSERVAAAAVGVSHGLPGHVAKQTGVS